jgi:hypothetical protein
MRGDPLGVARSSRIHEICGGEEDEHEEHDEHDTQSEGKLDRITHSCMQEIQIKVEFPK